MNKSKGKEKASRSNNPIKTQTYKSAFEKNEKQLREEALKNVSEEEKLRQDAYDLAVKSATTKEYVYPYIPITTFWIYPVEKKYSHLSSEEITSFYLKNFVDPNYFPKDFLYYQEILRITGSVIFDSTTRSGGEWAYSKAFINKVITPEQWDGDLYRFKDISPETKNSHLKRFYFNYFDYIQAWDMAFCYENRQKKHWFIQFKEQQVLNFSNWFIVWFSNWGLYPIILPNKIRIIFEDFVKTNPSLKNPGLMFIVLYQVPWIVKWDVVISYRSLQKLGLNFDNIPYIGRRILTKWWDKYEFFKESVFSIKGIIDLEPPKITPPPQKKKDLSEVLKEFLAGTSKKDLKKDLKDQLKELLETSSEGEEDDLMSQGTDYSDPMQDSQDPYPPPKGINF
ncbi:hypothetical protein DH2020_022141 [Rehmannia glutinosa]|uniref:Uncharacterized protein n=1 Tax=Rehmannia glutinosa TaxID=99300 RepID=A0ABR0WFD7_REHGL